ncbi:MAG: hypothetical protein SVV03_03995 [Candidatus Nanohaloarchaea archaeon]|nr:hypothetical protein [Candidatus Nanohaloarchaea archaeon]
MSEDVFCGLVMQKEKGIPCGVAFISDELECFSEKEDKRILEMVADRKPEVVAFTTPLKADHKLKGFSDEEEELVDEGYSFLPRDMHDQAEMERTEFMKNSLKRHAPESEIIECRPMVTAEILGIEGDPDLEDLGMNTENIHSTTEFEAVLAAITAKYYANNMYRDKGFVVPKEE